MTSFYEAEVPNVNSCLTRGCPSVSAHSCPQGMPTSSLLQTGNKSSGEIQVTVCWTVLQQQGEWRRGVTR